MKKTLIFASMALLVGLGACKKNSSSSSTPLQLLQHKWNLNKVVNHQKTSTTYDTTTTNFTNSTEEFKTDMKEYTNWGNQIYDTLSYSINTAGDSVNIDGDGYKIVTLTESTLQLYGKFVQNATDYSEETDYLTR